jgi:hypothetical protein
LNHSDDLTDGLDTMLIDDAGGNSLTVALEFDFTLDSLIEGADLTMSTTPMNALLRGVDEQREFDSSPRLSRGLPELPIEGIETHKTMIGDLVASGRPDVSSVSVPGVSGEWFSKLRLVSLNCHGLCGNFEYVRILQERADLIFLQETWLREEENIDFAVNASEFALHSKAASTRLGTNQGRPSGGIMWLLKKSLNKPKVKFISDRISTVEFDDILLIGVYLRFDDNSLETLVEHQNDMDRIGELVEGSVGRRVAVVGDFNSDLRRKRKTKFDKVLKTLIEENRLTAIDHLFTQPIDFTFRSHNKKSWIDHILVNSKLAMSVIEVNIIDEAINVSDHRSIEFEFSCDLTIHQLTKVRKRKLKPDWDNNQFRVQYESNLNELLANVNTKSLICATKQNVVMMLDEFTNNMNSSIRQAVERTQVDFSHPKRNTTRHCKRKKWWDEEMEYIKQQVNAAYLRYKFSNFDSTALLSDWKVLRKHFRYKQREKVKLNQKRMQKKLEMLFRLNKKEFWREIKNKNKKAEQVNIELNELKQSFSDLFNKKIVELRNEDEKKAHEQFVNEIESAVVQNLSTIGEERLNYSINSAELNMILKSLGNNKAIGFAEVSNEMIKYGGEQLTYFIKLILEKVFQFGKLSHFFNVGKIIPILKDDTASASDINNTRPITISDTLSNIFEKIALLEIEKYQRDHNMQFGFKKNSSCNHVIFVLKETANFYSSKYKSVYACAIDASKAFDKINRMMLMYKLIGKVPEPIWRALYVYYSNSVAYISNGNMTSLLFKTTIGVKQGGPLSPRLFSLYVEALIEELENSELGTNVNGMCTGVIMYADDLVVMSDNKQKLQEMLYIVESYCKKWEIKINANKTQFIKLGSYDRESRVPLQLDNQRIERVQKFKYLGVWIDGDIKAAEHVEEKVVSTVSAFNSMRKIGITNFSTSYSLKSFIYKVYCRPILYYGVENLRLLKGDTKKIQSTEATLIKYALNLSKTSRTNKLILAMNLEPAIERIERIKLNFFMRIMKNEATASIMESIIDEYKLNGDRRLIKNSLLGFLIESVGEGVLVKEERVALIKSKLNELKESRKVAMRCGVVDSIRTCLENRDEINDKMLKLLVQSFERIKKPIQTTHTSQTRKSNRNKK